jgi:hypothetical protein
MKPTLLALTALGALAAAAGPAAAQNYGTYNNGYYGQNGYYSSTNNDRYYDRNSTSGYGWEAQLNSRTAIDTRINRLDARLQAGLRAGTIDRYEAGRLRAEINDLRNLSRSYAYGGLTASERADLAARLRSVREDIRTADNGSWDRYDNSYWGPSTGYGYNNGTTGYGSAYGSGSTGTYNNGYGSNGYNGYGSRANNGYYGQGGPYEEVQTCDSRSGIVGGLIDSVVGRNCATTLRVGERATGNLYSVPYELRNTYRDGYNVYYRTDGQTVYQIDARTNTVVRAYPMNR